MRELVWMVMIGIVTACGGGKSAPAPEMPANTTAPDCASTAGALTRALASEDTLGEVGKVTPAVTKRCEDDKWTAEAVSCFGTAKDEDAVKACGYNHLTQAQQDKLDKETAPLGRASTGRVMKKMDEFKNKMCACKDDKCAMLVSDEMTKWSQDLSRQKAVPPRLTEEQAKQAADIAEEMGKCMQAAMMANQPPPPPPQPLSVTGIEPDKGDASGGTYVKIVGTSFIADGPRNVTVYFGKVQGSVIRFASDTELIVQAPGGKAKQTVDVLLRFDPGGELKLPKAFTYVKR